MTGTMLARMWRVVLLFLAASLVLPASSHAEPTGRLLVSLRPPAEGHATIAAAATAVAARSGARPAGPGVPELRVITVEPGPGETLPELARRLRRDPAVASVDVEHRATPRALPDDPALTIPDPAPGAAGESLQWWAARSHFPQAWELADGDSVSVAVVDQGVDGTHPDVAPKIRALNDLDRDPTHGAANVDESGHGTHVASLACGQPGNGFGIAGAGFACGLIVEKSDLSDESVVRAIVDATDRGAGVISMSIGTDDRRRAPRAMVDAVRYAYDRGVVLVAAASDKPTTEQGDPANILQPTGTGPRPDAGKGLTVTAADFGGGKARFAGDGSQISIAAYGAFERPGPNGILGAFPAATGRPLIEIGTPGSKPCGCRGDLGGDPRFAFLEGTSMATPIVAGAAALVRDLNPDLGPADVISVLKRSAQRRPGEGWTNALGWGVVDAAAALELAATIDRRPPTSSVTAPATTSSDSVVLRIAAHDTAAPAVEAAGVREVRVYARVGNGRSELVATTTAATARIAVRPGRRYAFHTRAVDRAGNVETAPRSPDAHTRVAPG